METKRITLYLGDDPVLASVAVLDRNSRAVTAADVAWRVGRPGVLDARTRSDGKLVLIPKSVGQTSILVGTKGPADDGKTVTPLGASELLVDVLPRNGHTLIVDVGKPDASLRPPAPRPGAEPPAGLSQKLATDRANIVRDLANRVTRGELRQVEADAQLADWDNANGAGVQTGTAAARAAFIAHLDAAPAGTLTPQARAAQIAAWDRGAHGDDGRPGADRVSVVADLDRRVAGGQLSATERATQLAAWDAANRAVPRAAADPHDAQARDKQLAEQGRPGESPYDYATVADLDPFF